jgi:hypothetical protein
LNINLLLKPTRNFLHLLTENNLHTTITTPTRYDPANEDTATLIDHTLTTRTDTQITAGTISPPITDHLPTYTIFHKPITRIQLARKTLSIAAYNKNKTKILTDIETAIIATTTNTTPETTTSKIFHNIQTAMQRTIEKYQTTPKRRKNHWLTAQYKQQIQKQHKLYRLRIQQPTPLNIRTHAQYRNKLAKRIKYDKKQSLTKKLEEAKKDPKLCTKILNTIIPKKNTSRTSPTELTYENKTLTDPNQIANALNDHYITIGHKTATTIPQDNDDQIEDNEPNHNTPSFTLQRTTEEIVTKKMKLINRNKASDIYTIKPTILKDLTPFLSPILTTLFNRSIDENEYPDSLKLTKAIELYKAKDKTLPENYRPISLLPIIAKLLDTIINEQLMVHLTKHNIISPTQYAFRPNSNCTLALQTILNNIMKSKKNHKPTLAIYIDLSKAYDTISHEKLIRKLRDEFNFTPATVAFFASYFQNRLQSIHTQHAQSKTQTITHGIPQGSTLSTTFFLLYINNIISTVPNSKVFTYADDTTLVITTETEQELNTLATSELRNLLKYFHQNNLVPNPTKTQFSVFYPKPTTHPIQLQVHGKQIQETDQAPLLGITVQNNLSHVRTITNIIRKLQPTIQKFRYANKLLPTRIMKQQYYSLVYPHLIGAISIWGTNKPNSTRLQPLIRTQKKILRILKNLPPRTHTKPILIELELLSIPDLYTLRVCTEMHSYIYPPKAVNRPEHNHHYTSTATVHKHRTRHSQQATLHPRHDMEHYTKRHTELWNALPSELRQTQELETFKKDLNNFLLTQQKNSDL